MSILSITVRPNTKVATEDVLKMYYEPLQGYLQRRSTRHAIVLEKGSSEVHNHYQCVVDYPHDPETIRQFLKPKYKKLPGYHPDYTFKINNQTKVGEKMFGYVMKEADKLVCDIKGISEQEMQHFAEEFAKLPDFKSKSKKILVDKQMEKEEKKERKRRQSFKNVCECADYLWEHLPNRKVLKEVYLEKPKYRHVWIPGHNEKIERVRSHPRYEDAKLLITPKIFVEGRWEEEQIDYEYIHVGYVKDSTKCTRKWAKALLISRGVELEDTTFANTYMKHYDSIFEKLKRREIDEEEKIIFPTDESIMSDDEGSVSSLGIEETVTNYTLTESGVTE